MANIGKRPKREPDSSTSSDEAYFPVFEEEDEDIDSYCDFDSEVSELSSDDSFFDNSNDSDSEDLS